MSKKKSIAIINLIVALLIAIFTIGYAFAWLAENERSEDFRFGGSAGSAYFAGGTGVADDPYTITNKYHMYNLAWLQDTGRFGNNKYYFALAADVDLADMWLPPIGTDADPFMGEFDGAGYTISNLKITTNRDKLTNCPVVNNVNFKFSQAVGFFGYTANKAEDNVSYIHNFIMDNPIVEVASVNAPYSTEVENNMVAGLAIGCVNGKANSIGVLATDGGTNDTQLYVGITGYSTYNSIIGKVGNGGSSAVTGGGNSGSGAAGGIGANYGNTFDVATLYSRILSIGLAKYGESECTKNKVLTENVKAWKLPALDNSSSQWTIGKLDKLSFAIGEGHYDDEYPYETYSDKNIGYFLGNQTKIQTKKLNFVDPLEVGVDGVYRANKNGTLGLPSDLNVTPRWLYTQPITDWGDSAYDSARGFAPITVATWENLPRGIKNLIPAVNGQSDDYTTIRVQADFTEYTTVSAPEQLSAVNPHDSAWSYHGEISWNGNVYGSGYKGSANSNGIGYTLNSDGNYITQEGYVIEEVAGMNGNDGYARVGSLTGPYVIDVNGWTVPVYERDSNGVAILTYGGHAYQYYTDGHLIDDTIYKDPNAVWNGTYKYLFDFDAQHNKRYVGAIDGWALPIYGVDSQGYALDENDNRYTVSAYYEVDDNGFYKRKSDHTYVISTPGWNTPIYVVDEDGYAMTANGNYYYTTTVGIYQNGSLKMYDISGNPLVRQGDNLIVPEHIEAGTGYAYKINDNSQTLYYTDSPNRYLMLDGSTYYLVNEDGEKLIDNNGIYEVPAGFDADGHAYNSEGYYYNAKDNNKYYHLVNGKHYIVEKSSNAGNVWVYKVTNLSTPVTRIDDDGYAMYDEDLYYSNRDGWFVTAGTEYMFHRIGEDDYYMGNVRADWALLNSRYIDSNGIMRVTADDSYALDAHGNIIAEAGIYLAEDGAPVLDGEGNMILMPYHPVGNDGKAYYTFGGVDVTVDYVIAYGGTGSLALRIHTGNSYDNTPNKVKAECTEDVYQTLNLASAATGKTGDILQQATGTLGDRVQATSSTGAETYLKVAEIGNDYTRAKVKTAQKVQFQQYAGGIFLPNTGVWFKPTAAGVIRFVMFADNDKQNFALFKVERPMHEDRSVSFDDKNIKVTRVIQQKLPSKVMFYYEWEVSENDIANGNVEFFIQRYGDSSAGNNEEKNAAFLLYLDLGASALVDGEGDISTIIPEAAVSAIDFVYSGVSINQTSGLTGISVGDFIVLSGSERELYKASKTSIYFEELKAIVSIVYIRHEGSTGEPVTIEAATTPTNTEEVLATVSVYASIT